jgi:hypothetical protein
MAIGLASIPLSRLMDRLGVGDCIEIHARKPASAPV